MSFSPLQRPLMAVTHWSHSDEAIFLAIVSYRRTSLAKILSMTLVGSAHFDLSQCKLQIIHFPIISLPGLYYKYITELYCPHSKVSWQQKRDYLNIRPPVLISNPWLRCFYICSPLLVNQKNYSTYFLRNILEENVPLRPIWFLQHFLNSSLSHKRIERNLKR